MSLLSLAIAILITWLRMKVDSDVLTIIWDENSRRLEIYCMEIAIICIHGHDQYAMVMIYSKEKNLNWKSFE
jgi:hypothetical protein